MEIAPNKECTRKKDDMECTINFLKKYKISIKKPLIPLKVFLFCFYGGGSFISAFLTVYFKQRGVTLAELSTAYMVAPAVQVGGTLLSGVIADKIGRSKPVLVANLALTLLIMACIMLVPRPNYVDCYKQTVSIKCDSLLKTYTTKINCQKEQFKESVCVEKCLIDFTQNCIAETTARNTTIFPKLLEYDRNETSEVGNICKSKNFAVCECSLSNSSFCGIVCEHESNNKCYDESQRNILSKVIMLLFILFMTAFSNCYRISDVTTMHLVTEHDAEYGKQRLFSMIGTVIISSLAGYLVKITTPLGGEQNYSTAFYLFISFLIFCILVVHKLDVQVKPPGKKMREKASKLLKNPDILVFAFVLLILGTSWMFTAKFVFWYLEEMQAPSVLIGLILAIGALYGIPFLFTSEWWMKTIGTTKFFVIGLLGYVICGIGYSFLKDPWLSLLLESHNIVTYHLLWVAVILRSHEISPEGLTATVISTAGSIHYQLGKTSGSLIARVVMNHFGGPAAYRFLAGMCSVVAVFYSVYLYCRKCCKKKTQGRRN